MDMLSTLGDEELGPSRHLENFSGSRKNLTSHEKGDELLTDFPKVHIPAHEEIFMAAVGIAEGIRIVLEYEDVAGKPFFTQAFLGDGEATFQNALAGFVVNDEVDEVIALGSGVFRMAAGVLVKPGSISQKGIRGPTVGNEPLKNVTEDFFNWKINPSIW